MNMSLVDLIFFLEGSCWSKQFLSHENGRLFWIMSHRPGGSFLIFSRGMTWTARGSKDMNSSSLTNLRRSLGSEADRRLARAGVSAAASRTAAKSSILPGLATDESLSSISLLVGRMTLISDWNAWCSMSEDL